MVTVSSRARQTVATARAEVAAILDRRDTRLLVICGPCSIHDVTAGMEYARRLRDLAELHRETLCVVMRTYFEKPRTTVGWKGLVNDPDLDNSFNINKGLRISRQFLADVNDIGLPAAVEFLDTITPQYLADLVAWGAIGARTSESQLHRELASGLSMPVGFKNGTGGCVQLAVDAAKCASSPHAFIGTTKNGTSAIIHTSGNPNAHVILRGGKRTGPQYSRQWVDDVHRLLVEARVQNPAVVVDCSHGNSEKDFRRQPHVAAEVARQVARRDDGGWVSGVMIESNIHEGSQNLPSTGVGGSEPQAAVQPLAYGVSVTDGCINLETTESVLQILSEAVHQHRNHTMT